MEYQRALKRGKTMTLLVCDKLGPYEILAPIAVGGWMKWIKAAITPPDQFSLGLVRYELAGGKRAFERGSVAEIMTAIIREEAAPLPPSVPAPFRWIVERLKRR
jgi:hypothetical protein